MRREAANDSPYGLVVPSGAWAEGDTRFYEVVITQMIPPIAFATTAHDVITHLGRQQDSRQ